MIEELTNEEDLEPVFQAEVALIYKHSTRCGLSAISNRQVKRFAEENTDVAVYRIDVIANRGVSNAVAERLGIPHQSPQAILLRRGEPVWHASHGSVRARTIARALEASD
jgi:bacillithiol system protein YtxJ